jgi:mRNA-degrading endonuclease RelE of RelBE toxin-antitoxin system
VYCSKFTPDALENAKALPKNVRNALKKEFERELHVDPVSCSVPLGGDLEQFRSFHYGDYRVVFQVFDDIKAIAVVGIGQKDAHHHAEIYKQLEVLAQSGKLAETVLETYRSLSSRPKS